MDKPNLNNVPDSVKALMELQKRIQSLVEPFILKTEQLINNSQLGTILQNFANWEQSFLLPIANQWVKQQYQWQKALRSSLSDETIAILNALNNQSLAQTLQNIERFQSLIEPEFIKEVEQETVENVSDLANFSKDTVPIVQAVIVGDDKKTQQFTPEQIKKALIWIVVFAIPYLCTVTGYTLKDFIEMWQPTVKQTICQDYQIENAENAEIRKVRLNKGTLNVRQYPNEKGKILAELPNGELICLPNKPKGNQRWLKVNIKDDNNNIITGYVNARFTEKTTFINGEKL